MTSAIQRSIWSVASIVIFPLSIITTETGTALWAASGESPGAAKLRIVRQIAYTRSPDAKSGQRQTLDLYLPSAAPTKPPLLIFIHGGFWVLSDDEYRIGPALAETLAPSGVAVGLVRYRLAPANRHPSQAQDVAAAVAYLARAADRYGYDGKRVFLAGHSAGAHLGALIALDDRYLRAHQFNPQSLAGVIAISGIFDLKPRAETGEDQKQAVAWAFGSNPDLLTSASPITHARREAPPFLVLNGSSDFPGFAVDAKRFADRLQAQGHGAVQRSLVSGKDHFSIVDWKALDDPVRNLVLAFLGIKSSSRSESSKTSR
jgi:arylformamidase